MGEPACRLNIGSRLTKAGFYSYRAATGEITAVVAGTSTLGHILALRNAGLVALHVMRMRLSWNSTVDPSALQRVGFLINKLTGFTALHTGGTGPSSPTVTQRREGTTGSTGGYASLATPVTSRVAGTDALTAGTQTIGDDLGRAMGIALIAAATVKKTAFEREWVSPDKHPLFIIGKDEGILVRNEVLMANSLAGIVGFEFDCWARNNGVA
jgi:hypothetical protein